MSFLPSAELQEQFLSTFFETSRGYPFSKTQDHRPGEQTGQNESLMAFVKHTFSTSLLRFHFATSFNLSSAMSRCTPHEVRGKRKWERN